MKIITILMVVSFFLHSNAFAHVKTLYSDKGITTYCVDGMKFAVAEGIGIVQVMENIDNHAVPRMCSMK